MKDAQGHGSNSRGDAYSTSRPAGSGLPFHVSQNFGAVSRMRPDRDFKTDADRTVSDLRSRMSNTGPGHSVGLLQGIKNLLGG